MQPPKMSVPKMLASLRESRAADKLGSAGGAFGIVLVALGWILEGESIGTAIRTLGGIIFLSGLAAIVFGDSRRRADVIGMFRRKGARYMSRTANWGWPDRVGLAGVAIGVALVVPALVLQIIFRSGAVIALPAVILFWGGVGLLIYGRFFRMDAEQTRPESSSPSHKEERGRGRIWR